MNLLHKSFNVPSCKVVSKDEGIIEAIVSVFNNVDSAKERVRPGFFKDSLSRKSPKGVWMHNWDQPVAKTLEAKELQAGDPLLPEAIREYGGLYVKGQFNLNTQRGREAFSDLDFGSVDEFSFGYQVTESEKDAKTGITDLIKGDIYEWSPVLVGCNPATALISAKDAKGAEFKAQYLGEYVESSMTMAAIRTLNDALFWNVLYDLIYPYGADLPLEDRVATIRAAFDEFRDLSLRTIETLLAGLAQEDAGAEAEAKSLRVLWDDPETTKDLSLLSLAEKTMADHSETALAAVTGLKDRLAGLRDLRKKDGRTLSEANRGRLQQHHDALAGVCEDLKSLLEETAKASSDDTETEKADEAARQARMRFERFRAERLGVLV